MKTAQQTKAYGIKERIFGIIQIAGGKDAVSKTYDRFIITLILMSIVITTAQTFDLPRAYSQALYILDAFCMICFTIEYALRIWTADLLYPSARFPRLRFIVSPSGLIDLFSILPFYLSGLVPAGMVVFRLIRVARILRLFRINRYLDPVSAILSVLRRKASMILASWFLVFVLMFSSSLLLYYTEHDAQPTVFKNAFSGLWWSVSTLSTTGYGDIYPVTVLGKVLAIIITLLGMCIVAIPTGILTSGFMEAAKHTYPRADSPDDSPSAGREIIDISLHNTTVYSPAFINPDLSSTDQLSLSCFVGPCIVETFSGEISPENIGSIISKASGDASCRIILRGEACLSEQTAQFMAGFGIMLLGFSMNIVPDNDISRILLSGRIALLCGLDLDSIDDGEYFLNAAPVLSGNKASSPCRAFLMKMTDTEG